MNFYNDVQHLLGDANPERAPTAKENLACWERIIEGSDEDIDIFITSNLRLVTSALLSFLQRHSRAKYLLHDLFSTGLLRITLVTHSMAKRGREDKEWFRENFGVIDEDGYLLVVRYLYATIYRKIQRTYEKDSIQPISDRYRKRFTPDSEDTPLRKVRIRDSVFEEISCDPLQEISLMMDILEVCRNSEERAIIKMSVTKTIRVIADELNCSFRHVFKIKEQVYARFCREYNLSQEKS